MRLFYLFTSGRIAIAFACLQAFPHKWIIAGMFHIGLGMVFFTLRPYKKKWMNYTDGLFLYILGTFMVMRFFERSAIIAGLTMVSVALAFPGMYMMYKYTIEDFKILEVSSVYNFLALQTLPSIANTESDNSY